MRDLIFLCVQELTKWNALLSGLTLCFSIYLIRLQLVYLEKEIEVISNMQIIDTAKFSW